MKPSLDLRGEVLNLLLYQDDGAPPILLPFYADLSTATVTFTLYGDDGATVLAKTDADGLDVQANKEIDPVTTEIVNSTAWSLVGFEPFSEAEWESMATVVPCRYELRFVIGNDAYTAYRGTWTVTRRIA